MSLENSIFNEHELQLHKAIREKAKLERICPSVCCFFVRNNYILGNPSPSYGKIGTIAGKQDLLPSGKYESSVEAIKREIKEETANQIDIDSIKLTNPVLSFEYIKNLIYVTKSYKANLPESFEPKLPISKDNLESLPILIHKDAMAPMEFFGFNPPNNLSLMSWSFGITRVVEKKSLEEFSKQEIDAFLIFLENLEKSMKITKERGLQMLSHLELAEQTKSKIENKINGIKYRVQEEK
jgi:hypothetical protein